MKDLMKHFTFAIVIVVFTMLAKNESASAQAVGTYCSAKTAEGLWAVKFGPQSIAFNCAAVNRVLRSATISDITDTRVGFYNIFGVNRVFTACGFYYHNIQTSTGAFALQNAIHAARVSGLTHCLFMVNDF